MSVSNLLPTNLTFITEYWQIIVANFFPIHSLLAARVYECDWTRRREMSRDV